MDPDFEIVDTTVIRRGKFTWIPNLQQIDDVKYIELAKWDRCFVQFATGKCLDFRNGKSFTANVSVFDRLLAARKQVTHDTIVDILRASEDEVAVPAGRSAKRRKISWQEVCSSDIMAPKCISITVDNYTMRVLSGLKSNSVWMELTAENLKFLQASVAQCLGAKEPGRHWVKKRSSSSESGNKISGEQSSPVNLGDS
jgi:hypothetical protein